MQDFYSRPRSPFDASAAERLRRMGLASSGGQPDPDVMSVFSRIFAGQFYYQLPDSPAQVALFIEGLAPKLREKLLRQIIPLSRMPPSILWEPHYKHFTADLEYGSLLQEVYDRLQACREECRQCEAEMTFSTLRMSRVEISLFDTVKTCWAGDCRRNASVGTSTAVCRKRSREGGFSPASSAPRGMSCWACWAFAIVGFMIKSNSRG